MASFLLIACFMRMVGRFTAAMFVTFDIAFDVIMPKGRLLAQIRIDFRWKPSVYCCTALPSC